jgi:phosphoribosylanthranilate isomerase
MKHPYYYPKVLKHDLQVVQLHGKGILSRIAKPVAKRYWNYKVFSIQDEFDFSALKPFEEFCDYFLFDTKGKLPGGNGTTFDWTVLKKYPSTKPFFLSDRTRRIKSSTRNNKTNLPVYAIDVNSKFEIEPGLKKNQWCEDTLNCPYNKKTNELPRKRKRLLWWIWGAYIPEMLYPNVEELRQNYLK